MKNDSKKVLNSLKKIVLEEVIKASEDYMKKEEIKQEIEKLMMSYISSGKISSEDELQEFWKTAKMAILSLEMIPYDIASKKYTLSQKYNKTWSN